MNVAYLDPPYSAYFGRLSSRLVRRTGGRVVALLSSPAYRLYTGTDPVHVCPHGHAIPAPLPPDAEHALWSQKIDDEFRSLFWHTVGWFRQRFRAEGIGLCLAFSDARPFSLAAAVAARAEGVQVLYFERGAFRYRTASLSTQGLNARFSLDRARQQPQIAGTSPEAARRRRPVEPGLKGRFALFIAVSAVVGALQPWRTRLQHKRYAFAPYVRLALVQWWAERRLARTPEASLRLEPGTPVLVLPLQLPGDSQMIMGSPFPDNQTMLEFVVSEARAVMPELRILVKRHPMDSTGYRMPPGAEAVGGNLERLHALEPVFVCVNSTVGFEAAAAGRPVLCFGPSFYTGSAPVRRVTTHDFRGHLKAALSDRGVQASGADLLRDVLRWYQAPGDCWAYTEDDLDRTTEIVLQHVVATAPLPSAASAERGEQPLPEVVREQHAA